MFSEQTLRKIYYQKVDLLLNGLQITQEFLDSVRIFSPEFYKGRKGGAGPAGGRYFRFQNGSVVNAGLWGVQSERSHLYLKQAFGYRSERPTHLICQVYNSRTNENYKIDLLPIPIAYNSADNISNTKNSQIALVHGSSCLASTIIQRCRYWRESKACTFCGIEFSLQDGSTIERKSPEQLIHAIQDASQVGLCEHITLTMGTLAKLNKGAENYIEVVSKVKKEFPYLPIHIQIEPFEDLNKLGELKRAGVDTIGIHLEIPNDALREKFCPGKYETPRSLYESFWKESVKIFGTGQVSTFILLGFGEDLEETMDYVITIIKMGVIPNIMPVRYIIGTNLQYTPITFDNLIAIYDSIAKSFLKYKLDPTLHKAGCVRCTGCSAIVDAYVYHKISHQNN